MKRSRQWNLLGKTGLKKYCGGIILGCAVLMFGCSGGGGGSDSGGGNVSLFQNNFSFVRFSSDRGGADTGAEFTSGIGYVDLDGAGNLSYGITATANGQSVGEAFLPGTDSGTYSIDSNGAMSVDGEFAGYLGVNGNIIITTDSIPEDPTYMETGIGIGIEEGSGLSNSTLSGRYSFVRFSSDRGGADTGAQFTSGIGYIDFDGAGNLTYTVTGTANGQVSGEAFVPETVTATYSVTAGGEVTLGGGPVGYVSPDGNILVWTDRIPEDPTYMETGIAIGLKEGSGLSNSILNGRYSFVRYSSDRGGADTGAEFTSGVGYIDFDGAGNLTYTVTGTANGQASGEAFVPETVSATYSVAANGEVTIIGGHTGYVSADGNIFIWTDPIPEDPIYMETGIAVGLKTN